jgi:hypothetical protein
VAFDLPRPDVWRRVLATAREGAGVLSVPVPEGRFRPDDRPDDETVAAVAGVDLVRELPEVATWLSSFETERLVLGMYAYADSAAHVRLSMAADVRAPDAIAQRGATASLVYPRRRPTSTPCRSTACAWRASGGTTVAPDACSGAAAPGADVRARLPLHRDRHRRARGRHRRHPRPQQGPQLRVRQAVAALARGPRARRGHDGPLNVAPPRAPGRW